jgi:AsmA-like protein
MAHLRKWWKLPLILLALLIVAQAGASLLARTQRVHNYLVRRLEQSFGRTVEVQHFNVSLVPSPMLDAERVTIGEDPAFGQEYFLRADRLTAGFRWSRLLQGHFAFGTLSFGRPSLILARNEQGSWNLERWLPPPKRLSAAASDVYGPQPVSPANNRLQKVDIEDGRINFKVGDEKLPFAFLGVSGNVEQVSPGRWQLRLEAKPWRSGVTLQSAGVLEVRGDVAGTSARLRPAAIHVHWDKVSLADFFRLVHGDDYGARGTLALDATAKSGPVETTDSSGTSVWQPGDWSFSLQARASQIHGWDLTEHKDSPGVNVELDGRWNLPNRSLVAQHFAVETAKSNLRGSAQFSSGTLAPVCEIRVDSAGIQAADLLAWYRAFRPEVNEQVSVEQFFTGAMTLRGWPLEVHEVAFSSNGGEARIPGLNAALHIAGFEGGRQRSTLRVEPVRISYAPARTQVSTFTAAAPKRRTAPAIRSAVEITFAHDFDQHAGSIGIDGHVEKTEDVLAVAAAFGHPLNHGWELAGPATAALHWNWGRALQPRWNGRLEVSRGILQVAGLNQPLHLVKARLDWRDGLRSADIKDAGAFGASWSGQISQGVAPDPNGKWNFRLHANHLDATALDLWIGPRARPNWLERLLASLLGGMPSTSGTSGSALLRRVNAEGELRVDDFTLEKIKLSQIRAQASLRDLHLDVRDGEAQWAGGRVRARLTAAFLPRPAYSLTAELEGVELKQLPQSAQTSGRFAGIASGTLHLATQGIGHNELLAALVGKGDIQLRDVEFRGWDLQASAADGQPREGASRWATGEAAFAIRNLGIILGGLRLDAGSQKTLVKGSVSFSQDADLTIQTVSDPEREAGAPERQGGPAERHVLRISGPLDLPRVSVEKLVARQPAD